MHERGRKTTNKKNKEPTIEDPEYVVKRNRHAIRTNRAKHEAEVETLIKSGIGAIDEPTNHDLTKAPNNLIIHR